MGITLKKGQGVSLKKAEYDLSQVTVGLGWDVAEKKGGFWGKLFGQKNEEYDLDAVAFLLDQQGRVADWGAPANQKTLQGGDIIFYNNLSHKSGAIWLTGDNRTGTGEGDDEQIIVKLEQLPSQYHKIIFIVQIYQGIMKKQNFAQVKNAFIRACDKNNKEMCRFDISGDDKYAGYHSLTFAELERQGSEWSFKAIGIPHDADSFADLLADYLR